MSFTLAQVTADHRLLATAAAQVARIVNPVAIELDEFEYTVLQKAVRGPFFPVEGAFIRNGDRSMTRYWAGAKLGIRLYGVRRVNIYPPDALRG